ncbi:MAG: guanylate kinase [Firmicutes bacterium]|nr:guanylate kinase [Bacillota bacterium]
MGKRGFLVVLSGPSGVGKNTLLNAVLPTVEGLKYSVSATTRPPRPGEVHGRDYFFVSDEEFDAMLERGELLEWAEFVGRRYGTPRRYVDQCLAQGLTVILDIDIQGAAQVRAAMPEAVLVFLLPPSLEELRRRIYGRGKDPEAAIVKRLSAAKHELAAVTDYDYVIVNDDLAKARDELRAIILAERCRVSRSDYPSLIARLNQEGTNR